MVPLFQPGRGKIKQKLGETITKEAPPQTGEPCRVGFAIGLYRFSLTPCCKVSVRSLEFYRRALLRRY